ncbi:amino acid permease, partial [Francisella tularensis]|uniref:amino acid permease n=1 Tax=Francisella tularensis TaxID=263 RepID=UPI002381AE7F
TLSLTMLNISAIISLISIAYMATIGLQSVLFYLIAAVTFLLPTSIICAELSSMITQNNGGVFSWVKSGLGEKAGVFARWLEWFN